MTKIDWTDANSPDPKKHMGGGGDFNGGFATFDINRITEMTEQFTGGFGFPGENPTAPASSDDAAASE